MATTQQVSTFLELLEKSRLLPPEQIAAAVERHSSRNWSDAKDAAKALLHDGLLTRYQAQRLLAGHYRGFFIDQYKLLEILGAGGMGRLYVAQDAQTGQRLAVKVLSERHQDDAGMLARLKLEARAGMRLDHPNVVRTYKLAQSEDGFNTHYIAMEFVEGIGLEELIRSHGRRSWSQACNIIRQAALGLEHAHKRGLVHRDIKPGNLLIQHDGTVKITDFGLALLHDVGEDEFSLTMIFGHDLVGSAEYMAPEQARDSASVDARADVYSLGCTLYSAITGRFPFVCESVTKTLEAHRVRPPQPLRELVSDIPPELDAIYQKMMAKFPDDRFQSAAELANALAPFAKQTPVDFDFQAILASRASQARRRSQAHRQHKTRTRAASTLTSTAGLETGGKSSPALHETQVNQADTRKSSTKRPEPTVPRVDPGQASAVLEGTLPSDAAADHLAQSGSLLPSAAVLVPLGGGPPVPLMGERILIGRGADCDIRLNSPRVSSRHCELRFEGSWWRVRDLRSKNGVRVNGTQVQEQMLWPGDRLTVAEEHHFRIEGPGEKKPGNRAWLLYAAVGAAIAAAGAAAAFLAW